MSTSKWSCVSVQRTGSYRPEDRDSVWGLSLARVVRLTSADINTTQTFAKNLNLSMKCQSAWSPVPLFSARRLAVVFLCAMVSSCRGDGRCAKYASCASCTTAKYESSSLELNGWHLRRPRCAWCPLSSRCVSEKEDHCHAIDSNQTASTRFEYDCPLGPVPYPTQPIDFLPDWMCHMDGLLDDMTLVDLCLPGTHDSVSYDLSLTVSDDGIDEIEKLSNLLHKLSGGTLSILPGEMEDFFRMQAKTQQLSLTQQLDNGIRFLDFRMMLEADESDWYSIHFMQSKDTVHVYWREVRAWLDQHPNEVVVLWLSKHGNPSAKGHDQYPGVSREQKLHIWHEYMEIFSGLMLDTRHLDIFTDSFSELIANDYRLITYASDYEDFTGSSPFALDASTIQNVYDNGEGVFDAGATLASHKEYFQRAIDNNAAVHAQSGFTLLGMNSQGQSWQILAAARRRFLGWTREVFQTCATHIKIPGIGRWCPEVLLDIAQLASYYNQVALEYSLSNVNEGDHTGFPNAVYLDALDVDGTIRTGTQLLDGAERGGKDAWKDARYSYVDTIIAYNVKRACQDHQNDQLCGDLENKLSSRRSVHPAAEWDEPQRGRRRDWSDGTSIL